MNIIKKIKENKRKNDSCAKIIEMDGKYINELLEIIKIQNNKLLEIRYLCLRDEEALYGESINTIQEILKVINNE